MEEEDLDLNEETTETKDYEALYNQEKERADKYENRFKKTAKELNERKKVEPTFDKDAITRQVSEEMYYANNPLAKQFKTEISAIQTRTGMTPEESMTFYLAQNKPELLIKSSKSGVDGTDAEIAAKKDFRSMSYEEIRDKNAGT